MISNTNYFNNPPHNYTDISIQCSPASENKPPFHQLLNSNELLRTIFSFLGPYHSEQLTLSCRHIHSIINSTEQWNVHVINLCQIAKKKLLSLSSMDLRKKSGTTVSMEEKKALQVFLSVLRYSQDFFERVSSESAEFPFILSPSGEATFLSPSDGIKPTYYLITRKSEKINEVHEQIAAHYNNDFTPQKLFTYAIVDASFKATFFDESDTSSIQKRTMLLFVRFLNSLVHQKKVSSNELPKGFMHEDTSVIFEEVMDDEQKLISGQSHDLSHLDFSNLSGINCPQNIVKELSLPLYRSKLSENQLVVAFQFPRTYRYAIVERLNSTSTYNPASEENEFLYSLLIKHSSSSALHHLPKLESPASMIYPVPPRAIESIRKHHSQDLIASTKSHAPTED